MAPAPYCEPGYTCAHKIVVSSSEPLVKITADLHACREAPGTGVKQKP